MKENSMIDVDKIEKRTVRSFYDDGVFEIALGSVFVLLGGYLFVQTALPKGSALAAIMSIALIGVIFLAGFLISRIIRVLKRRITYPRTGYVAFKKHPVSPRRRLRAGLFGGFMGLLLVLLLALAPSLSVLLPVMISFPVANVAFKIANKVGVPRFFVLAAVSAVIGFALTAAGIGGARGIGLAFGLVGGCLILSGSTALIIYLRRNPRPAPDAPEGSDAR
jgi:hypothetical protein